MITRLIWKEWKDSQWILVGFCALLLAEIGMAHLFIPNLQYYVDLDIWFTITTVIAAGIIGGYSFSSDRQTHGLVFLESLPISRSTIYWVKWCMGVVQVVLILMIWALLFFTYKADDLGHVEYIRRVLERGCLMWVMFHASFACSTWSKNPIVAALCGGVVMMVMRKPVDVGLCRMGLMTLYGGSLDSTYFNIMLALLAIGAFVVFHVKGWLVYMKFR